MNTQRKWKCISLEDKIKIIRDIERGETQAKICKCLQNLKLDLTKTTVNTIWKNKDSILSASENFSSKTKKLKTTYHEDIDEALLKWFTSQRSMNVPISGAMMQAKAEDFAKKLNKDDFTCSIGWLERFKKRHNITCGKFCGEVADVSSLVVEKWINEIWLQKRAEYSDEDIFNGDETGLFFKMTPDKTLKFKGERCIGGKHSKDRLTVFLCANMSGTEKRKLLVLGKSKNPRCFKDVKKLPVRYTVNRKAWMTSEIFSEEIRLWNKELSQKRRQILLVLDNCTAHPRMESLSSIELLFLPPNTTSKVQPMDQGVIRSLKLFYQKKFIQQLFLAQDNGEQFSVSLLDAIRMLNQAWLSVLSSTIRNCFRHAGLLAGEYDEDENIPLSEWLKKQSIETFNHKEDIDCFVSLDDELVTSEVPSDSDIVASVTKAVEENDDFDGSEEEIEEPMPSISDALNAAKTLSRFFECRSDDTETLQKSIMDIQNSIFKVASVHLKQKKITDYLSQ